MGGRAAGAARPSREVADYVDAAYVFDDVAETTPRTPSLTRIGTLVAEA